MYAHALTRGAPFPEKISGSDFVPRLVVLAAREGWRVFLLGAAEGVGAKAAELLESQHPLLGLALLRRRRLR